MDKATAGCRVSCSYSNLALHFYFQIRMFRRSRFSVRPNVSAVGRTTAGTSQEPPAAANQEVSEKPKEAGDGAAAVTDKSNGTPTENITASG